MHVGGEFVNDDRWKLPRRSTFPGQIGLTYFLNGGQACLRVIANWLQDQNIETILLPAYLCPTIPAVITACGIRIEFYRVRDDFSIDLDHLSKLVKSYPNPAIYFINYFGFSPCDECFNYFLKLQQSGLIFVEDNAQAGFVEHPIGDFVFNSLRKLCPHDGAYLNTRFPLQHYIEQYSGRVNHRLPIIRRYRERYARYLAGENIDADELDELFALSESFYTSDQVVLGDPDEQVGIESLDWRSIRQVRRENYLYLINALKHLKEISPIFPSLQEHNMPFGLPVYFSGVSRDAVNILLGKASIGLTIHWEDMHKAPFNEVQSEAVSISQRMLTLTIDQYTSRLQMDYLVEQLHQAVLHVKL